MATTAATSSSSSSLASVSGISSGIDWTSLVDSIIAKDKQQEVRMQAQAAAGTKRQAAYAALGTQLQTMQGIADTLKAGASGSVFATFAVSAPGADAAGRAVLAATTDSTAMPASADVTVTALATAAKETGGVGFAPGATLPTSGTFTLTRPNGSGGSTTLGQITLTSASTLASVRDSVNALNTGAAPSGVTASLITVAPGDQRLVITAASTGKASGFSLSDGGNGVLASLGLDPAGAKPPVSRAASDASLTVDGVPVTSPTNTVSGAIQGVTLALSATGTTTVDVTQSTKAASDAAQSFVDNYNKMVTSVRAQTAPGQVLAGDTLARGLPHALATTILTEATPAVSGQAGVASDLTTLSALGITVQKDGSLALDSAKFQSVAASRPNDVAALLTDRMGAISSSIATTSAPVTGQLATQGRAIDDTNARINQRIADIDSREDKKRTALLAQYAKYEAAIGQLQSIGSNLAGQFASLSGTSTK